MLRFALRRFARIIWISLAIVFFCALGLRMTARSPIGSSSYTVLELARDTMKDVSVYLRCLASGNLGSVWRGASRARVTVPVAALAADTYAKSMGLLVVSLLIGAFLGVGSGLLAAYLEGSPASLAVITTTLLGVSLPSFFTALLLQVAEITVYQRTGVRLVPVGGFGWDAHLILPALVLAARPLAQLARITFVAASEAVQEDYVRTAHAKGLAQRQVWAEHILPNCSVPVLTALGLSLRFSLGSLPVVEYFFGWPGLGATLLSAIRARHLNLVITLALALGVTFMLLNLGLELAYRAFDPRLRDSANEEKPLD